MSKRGGIKYVQNEEPAFIQQFKQKIGYKEGPDVNTKRQKLDYDDDDEDRSDTEEEKPVVVVLKKGDLTKEEASEAEKAKKKEEEDAAIRDGKITFKKPVKKSQDAPTEGSDSGTDKAQPSANKSKSTDKKKKEKEKKKSNLLSFGDEEEEEDG